MWEQWEDAGQPIFRLRSLEFPPQTLESHRLRELVRWTFQKAHSGECSWEGDCRQGVKRPLEQPFRRDVLTTALAEEGERRGHHKEVFQEYHYQGGNLGLRAEAANPPAPFLSWLFLWAGPIVLSASHLPKSKHIYKRDEASASC